ncbi:unnamed protein product [Prorocentrum cordatum]|uniref:Uncharacterized protein n=1 Tax=Prorocentrum cordatum TaxID=2364126 RepID=A0ABN9RIV6_9DINO|nr:unnamed protein product [Polarella glacialis]
MRKEEVEEEEEGEESEGRREIHDIPQCIRPRPSTSSEGSCNPGPTQPTNIKPTLNESMQPHLEPEAPCYSTRAEQEEVEEQEEEEEGVTRITRAEPARAGAQ